MLLFRSSSFFYSSDIILHIIFYIFGNNCMLFLRYKKNWILNSYALHHCRASLHSGSIPCSFFSVSQNFCSSVKYLSKMKTLLNPKVAMPSGYWQRRSVSIPLLHFCSFFTRFSYDKHRNNTRSAVIRNDDASFFVSAVCTLRSTAFSSDRLTLLTAFYL